MPKDPFIAVNQRRAEAERERQTKEVQYLRRATEIIKNTSPEKFASAPAEVLEQHVKSVASELAAQEQASQPAPRSSLFDSPATRVSKELDRGIGANLVEKIPDAIRPNSVLTAMAPRAVEQAVDPDQDVGLDAVGEIGQMIVPALTGLAAQTPPGRVAAGVRAVGGAMLGAGVMGGVQQQLEAAQRIIDQTKRGDEERVGYLEALRRAPQDVQVSDMFYRGMGEAMFEVAPTGLAFFKHARGIAFAKMARLTGEQSDRLVRLATDYNVDVAIQDVAQSGLVRRARDIFGRFPSGNRPFLEGTEESAKQVGEAFRKSLGALTPTIDDVLKASVENPASKKILEANVRGFNKIQGAFRYFKEENQKLYTRFYNQASKEGAQVGYANAYAEGARVRMNILGGMRTKKTVSTGITDSSGKPIMKEILVDGSLSSDAAKAEKWIVEKILNGEDLPTVERFMNTANDLEDLIKQVSYESPKLAEKLIELKKAMKKDFETNLIGSDSIKALKASADAYYKDGMRVFGGQAGLRMKKIDRDFGKITMKDFDPGIDASIPNPATSSPEMVVQQMLGSSDPDVVKNLHKILTRGGDPQGQQVYEEMVGLHMESLFRDAATNIKGIDYPVTDLNKLIKSMGLDNSSGSRFRAYEEMLANINGKNGKGVKIQDFARVIELAHAKFDENVPDVSTMITRRMLLGGFGSGMRTGVPTWKKGSGSSGVGAILKEVTKAALFFASTRNGARMLTDPDKLKYFLKLTTEKGSAASRMNALKRLLILDATFLAFDNATGGYINDIKYNASNRAQDVVNMTRNAGRNLGELAGEAAEGFSVSTPLPDSR